MLSCTRNTALTARLQFGPRSAAKRSCRVVVVAARASSSDDGAFSHAKSADDDGFALCSRRRALASALFSSFAVVAVSPAAAVAATVAKKLPKLDAVKLYGSQEAAEAAAAAAAAGVRSTLASVDPSSAGVLLRLAFHDAGTWDGARRTGGANGSILNELERPENGGLKYGAALIGLARKASQAELPKGVRPLSDADFIQVAGAVAVEVAGGPRISVPLGRPDSKAKAGDPAGQLRESKNTAPGREGGSGGKGGGGDKENEERESYERGKKKRSVFFSFFFIPWAPPLLSHLLLSLSLSLSLSLLPTNAYEKKFTILVLQRLLPAPAERRRRVPLGPHARLRPRHEKDRRRIRQEQDQVLRGLCRRLRQDGPQGARGLKKEEKSGMWDFFFFRPPGYFSPHSRDGWPTLDKEKSEFFSLLLFFAFPSFLCSFIEKRKKERETGKLSFYSLRFLKNRPEQRVDGGEPVL